MTAGADFLRLYLKLSGLVTITVYKLYLRDFLSAISVFVEWQRLSVPN